MRSPSVPAGMTAQACQSTPRESREARNKGVSFTNLAFACLILRNLHKSCARVQLSGVSAMPATAPRALTSTGDASAILEDGSNEVAVGIVTAWELAIKQSLRKLDLPKPAELWLPVVLRRTGLSVEELGLSAALRVRALPLHHRGPFGRLLIAQALEAAGYTIMTRDDDFDTHQSSRAHLTAPRAASNAITASANGPTS